MKANEAPDKIYLNPLLMEDGESIVRRCTFERQRDSQIEYIRKDAFIEMALKWYCLDCECNDNCKDIKCFFYRQYERYLKGEKDTIPPKFSGRILNEDGSLSDNWRYRHFIIKMQDAFIEKACEMINNINCHYIRYSIAGASFDNKQFIEDFKKAMTL